MAIISSNGTGGGTWSVGASWNGGVAPGASDTAKIISGDTITLSADQQCTECSVESGGTLNLAGFTLSGDDFIVKSGGTLTVAGLDGSTIDMNNSVVFMGTDETNKLDLEATATWYVIAGSYASAKSVIVANCDASGGVKVLTTDDKSLDMGSNSNWDFLSGSTNVYDAPVRVSGADPLFDDTDVEKFLSPPMSLPTSTPNDLAYTETMFTAAAGAHYTQLHQRLFQRLGANVIWGNTVGAPSPIKFSDAFTGDLTSWTLSGTTTLGNDPLGGGRVMTVPSGSSADVVFPDDDVLENFELAFGFTVDDDTAVVSVIGNETNPIVSLLVSGQQLNFVGFSLGTVPFMTIEANKRYDVRVSAVDYLQKTYRVMVNGQPLVSAQFADTLAASTAGLTITHTSNGTSYWRYVRAVRR